MGEEGPELLLDSRLLMISIQAVANRPNPSRTSPSLAVMSRR
jgi:hypothetical protein